MNTLGITPKIHFEAQDAYRKGEGIEDNPYPEGVPERMEWALAMHECQYEEFKQLMGGFA